MPVLNKHALEAEVKAAIEVLDHLLLPGEVGGWRDTQEILPLCRRRPSLPPRPPRGASGCAGTVAVAICVDQHTAAGHLDVAFFQARQVCSRQLQDQVAMDAGPTAFTLKHPCARTPGLLPCRATPTCPPPQRTASFWKMHRA